MPLSTRARYPNIYLTIHIRPGSFPPRYHWGIFIPHPPSNSIGIERGVNFHMVDHVRAPYWRFEADFNYNLNDSAYVAAAIVIGQLRRSSIEQIHQLLYQIPIDVVPIEDIDSENTFSCRVWIREAIRVLHRAGIIRCDSVDDLEWEMRGYGERARYFSDHGYFQGAYVDVSRFSF